MRRRSRRVRPARAPRGRGLALVLAGGLAAVVPAKAAPEGAHAARIESEIKLAFPPAQADAVFGFVRDQLGDRQALAGYGPLRAETSEELFTDVYFDTRGWALLEGGHGVRHRTRAIPADPAHRKDGRQLVQVKTAAPSDDGSGVRRREYKFEVDPVAAARRGNGSRHPLLGLLPPRERVPLEERLEALGVRARELVPVLTLEQRRRRVYLHDPAGALATVTVDEVTARKAWWEAPSAEVELELNEIRFTEASSAERLRMEGLAEAIRAGLLARFPDVRQDQTPKYEKAVARFEARIPGFRTFGALHVTREQLGLGALVLAVALFAAVERRRRLRHAPVRGRIGQRISRARG